MIKLPYDNPIKSVLEAQNAVRCIADNSAVRQMLNNMDSLQAAMRAASGPIEQLGGTGIFDFESRWYRELERIRERMADLQPRFCLPEIAEAARLVADFRKNPVSEFLMTYSQQNADLQRAIDSMRTPWLDAHNAIRSMAGFAELQGIGDVLRKMPGFGDNLTAALRVNLGDWRDPITWRPEILIDLAVRSDFYASLGFNRALTDFPEPAFHESLDISGLRHPPELIDLYEPTLASSAEDNDGEENLARTNMAHDRLLRLETQLRSFIDEQMTRVFGADWAKHRLPNGLYEEWQAKKRKAEHAGATERPLIVYADFTDYERVICRSDNWREIFAPFFGRRESVRESFQRLYPIRLDTMHARLITQDDELLLYVETRRLVKVIPGRLN
jgi:hypothetical protein